VNVSWGSVEVIVLYCVDIMVSPGSDLVILRTSVIVLAGRIDVSVRMRALAGWIDVSVIEKMVVSVPVACGRVDVMNKVLAGWIEVRVIISVLAGKLVVKYTVSGGKMLVWVIKLSDTVVRVTAGCVEISTVVDAGCTLVMIKVSVVAGKNEVWIWTIVSVPVCMMNSVFVAVDGSS
jgi:hypothetical protein